MKSFYLRLFFTVPFFLIVLDIVARAEEYYVDPVFGSALNDGSRTTPWRSIQAVVDEIPLQPGDVINLRSGDHGHLSIRDRPNIGTVTITAEPGHTPSLNGVRVHSSTNWHLRGLHIGPAFGPNEIHASIVEIGPDAHGISIENCVISSAPDVSGWTASDWREKAVHGVNAAGSDIFLHGNHIKNIKHGIHSTARHTTIEHNVIENFAGDGIRGLGDHSVYQFNTIKNCYKIDDNHDDGFQSWSRGPGGAPGKGEVIKGVLRGNRIINYEDPLQPMRCTLQGIGMFDGMYVDWVIENNVVVSDHWHGITVMGARNVRIVNNTVMDPNDHPPGPPWISITHHKDGRAPENSVIANNVAPPRALHKANRFGLPKPGVVAVHNIAVTDPTVFFVDPGRYDFRLHASSPAIDAGSAVFAPKTDIVGTQRPQGASVDVGAYEAR